MTFLRSEHDIRWRRFRQERRALFDNLELPLHLTDSNEVFEDFLMHGYLDHHTLPFPFAAADLDDDQRLALIELVVVYIHEVRNPGLGLFDLATHEVIIERARRLDETAG